MIRISYHLAAATVPPRLDVGRVNTIAAQAAKEWNVAMTGLIRFIPSLLGAQVTIEFGEIDKSDKPDRIAVCIRRKSGGKITWRIVLDNHTQWDASAWWQFWSRGTDSLRAGITHELGHVFLEDPAKPGWHSDLAGDVMEPTLINHIIEDDEAERYRKRFWEVTNP